jgi:predicted ester cyclase
VTNSQPASKGPANWKFRAKTRQKPTRTSTRLISASTGPDGFEADYSGLTDYFKAIRAAFDDRSIRRGIIVAEGNYIACQTWIEGTFVREFTQSPAGSLPPNGQRVVWDLLNIFRFDDQGRLVEE